MSRARRLYYFLGLPVLRGIIGLLESTYRVEKVIGAQHIEPFIQGGTVCAPCYWHQHHVIGSTLIRSWVKRGFKACFLVSGLPVGLWAGQQTARKSSMFQLSR